MVLSILLFTPTLADAYVPAITRLFSEDVEVNKKLFTRVDRCKTEKNRNYVNPYLGTGDIANKAHVADINACIDYCKTKRASVYFTWAAISKHCTCKKSIGKDEHKKDYHSGLVECSQQADNRGLRTAAHRVLLGEDSPFIEDSQAEPEEGETRKFFTSLYNHVESAYNATTAVAGVVGDLGGVLCPIGKVVVGGVVAGVAGFKAGFHGAKAAFHERKLVVSHFLASASNVASHIETSLHNHGKSAYNAATAVAGGVGHVVGGVAGGVVAIGRGVVGGVVGVVGGFKAGFHGAKAAFHGRN